MIRYGVVSRERVPLEATTAHRRRFPLIALTILREFDENLSVSDEKLLDLVYATMRGGTHNFKLTFAGRYKAIDSQVVEEIERIFPDDRPLRIHDMAASNAITSLELFERLRHRDNVRVHASDYYDAVYVVSVGGSRWKVIVDAEHQPLQFVGTRMVIQASKIRRKERLRYPINWVIQRILFVTVLPKALRILKADAARNDDRVERIELFHPKCVATARSDPRFSLGRDNLLAPAAGFYDIIRVLGVVNFFPRDLMEPMFRAVCERVVDGGLLIVATTNYVEKDPAHVPTTVFQRRGARFAAIRDLCGSHPYRELILGLRLTAEAGSGQQP